MTERSETVVKRSAEVRALLAKGRRQGHLTYTEVHEALADSDLLDATQVEEVIKLISDWGISLVDEEEPRAGAAEGEEGPVFAGELESVPIDDSVRMYLRDIGKVPLLTAEQEVDLAQRIQKGEGTLHPDRRRGLRFQRHGDRQQAEDGQ